MSRSARITRTVGSALCALAVATAAGAQSLPDAKEILTRYREVSGNTARFGDIKSMHAKGEFSMPAASLSGSVEVWSARPNRSAMLIHAPGVGEMRSGYTGAVGWSINAMEGPRVLSGPEAVQAADEAHFESHLRPESLIASATTIEKTTLNGAECYRLKLTWKSGRESHDCYSIETGLLVASSGRTESSMGPMDATIFYSDVREFDGIKIPTRLSTRFMGVEQIIVLKEVHFNVVNDSVFEPPAEVKALIKR